MFNYILQAYLKYNGPVLAIDLCLASARHQHEEEEEEEEEGGEEEEEEGTSNKTLSQTEADPIAEITHDYKLSPSSFSVPSMLPRASPPSPASVAWNSLSNSANSPGV